MKKIIILISAVLMLVSMVSVADALIFGVRYSNLGQPVLQAVDSDQGNRSRFGIFGGVREQKHDFVVSLDFDRSKSEWGDSSSYARRFSGSIGYRYKLFSAEKIQGMNINPFIGLNYFKSYSKVEEENRSIEPEDLQYQKDMLNDSGYWLSFGAEYYFAPAYSMGCEAGVRYTQAKSKAYGNEIKFTDYTTFAAILLTFYWQ